MNTLMRKTDRVLLNAKEIPVALYADLGEGTFPFTGGTPVSHQNTTDLISGEIVQTAVWELQKGLVLKLQVSRMQSFVVPQMYALDVLLTCPNEKERFAGLTMDLLYPLYFNGFHVEGFYAEELEPGKKGLFAKLSREGTNYLSVTLLKDAKEEFMEMKEKGRHRFHFSEDGTIQCRQYFILIPSKDEDKDKQEAIRLLMTAVTLPLSYWQEQQRMYLKQIEE